MHAHTVRLPLLPYVEITAQDVELHKQGAAEDHADERTQHRECGKVPAVVTAVGTTLGSSACQAHSGMSRLTCSASHVLCHAHCYATHMKSLSNVSEDTGPLKSSSETVGGCISPGKVMPARRALTTPRVVASLPHLLAVSDQPIRYPAL